MGDLAVKICLKSPIFINYKFHRNNDKYTGTYCSVESEVYQSATLDTWIDDQPQIEPGKKPGK